MGLQRDIVESGQASPFDPFFSPELEAWLGRRAPFLAPRLPALVRLARFLTVGVVGLAVDTSVFALLFHNGAGAPVARAASLAVATLVTWWLNRRVTFAASGRPPLVEFARYAGVAAVAQGFNYGVFLFLHYATGETHPYPCLFAAAALTTVFSFTGQSVFAFARAPATRTAA